MDFLQTIEYFIANEGPWAILFVSLFAFTIRSNNQREEKMRAEMKEQRTSTRSQLNAIQQDTTLMLETWKLIIERELERRERN